MQVGEVAPNGMDGWLVSAAPSPWLCISPLPVTNRKMESLFHRQVTRQADRIRQTVIGLSALLKSANRGTLADSPSHDASGAEGLSQCRRTFHQLSRRDSEPAFLRNMPLLHLKMKQVVYPVEHPWKDRYNVWKEYYFFLSTVVISPTDVALRAEGKREEDKRKENWK